MKIKVDDYNYKFDSTRTDPTELKNRYDNYVLCVQKFVALYPTPLDIKNQLKRSDINRLCLFELMALRQFGDVTNFKYENFYHKIDPFIHDYYSHHI